MSSYITTFWSPKSELGDTGNAIMQTSDLAILAAVQVPTAALAAAGIYLALKMRTLGAVMVATALVLSFLNSLAGNLMPNQLRTVFDESGRIAGAMGEAGDAHLALGYVGFGLTVLLTLGLVLVARDWQRRGAGGVSPSKSLERTRDR
jgi:hypothetical protein